MAQSGKITTTFTPHLNQVAALTGEFDGTIDAKGRLALPSGLLKQLPDTHRQKFVVSRSIFKKCLVLYPMDAWEKIVADITSLSRFSRKADEFLRQYSNGATTVEVDSSNRILVPKRLAAYADIEKDIVLAAHVDNKVEIWNEKAYNELMNSFDSNAFGDLAEELLGNKAQGNNANIEE